MAARLNTIVAIAMLALYDEFDTYWQNGGYKKISDLIFAECHIFIVSNLCFRVPVEKPRIMLFLEPIEALAELHNSIDPLH
jgi:hypothetical protein